jgi:NAD(P)-dependent dehydrogenase (short-subunit alcohol dehydrogenase family)
VTAPEQRVALVTGAGAGMGRAIAIRLARDGYAVAVLDIDAASAKEAAEEIIGTGGSAIALGDVDVSVRQRVEAAVEQARQQLGPVLVLVNNAGITGFREFLKITDDKWDRLMRINLYGPYYCTQTVLPDMIAAGWGRIVNISSSAAQTGQQYMAHYAAAKAGLIGMTKSLALEFAGHGITVNTIPPGQIDTPMLRESARRGMLGDPEKIGDIVPVGRLGTPEDIAAAASYLCSEEAGYVTGQVIGVNGGRVTG